MLCSETLRLLYAHGSLRLQFHEKAAYLLMLCDALRTLCSVKLYKEVQEHLFTTHGADMTSNKRYKRRLQSLDKKHERAMTIRKLLIQISVVGETTEIIKDIDMLNIRIWTDNDWTDKDISPRTLCQTFVDQRLRLLPTVGNKSVERYISL